VSGHTRAALGIITFTSHMVAGRLASIRGANEIVARCVDTAESGKQTAQLTLEPVCGLPGPVPQRKLGDTGEKEGQNGALQHMQICIR